MLITYIHLYKMISPNFTGQMDRKIQKMKNQGCEAVRKKANNMLIIISLRFFLLIIIKSYTILYYTINQLKLI